MTFEVVDGHEGKAACGGEALCGHEADDDAANEAGTCGRRDAVEVVPAGLCLFHGAGDQAVEMLDMGPGGDFRYHAAERSVFLDLREDGVGQDFARPVRV